MKNDNKFQIEVIDSQVAAVTRRRKHGSLWRHEYLGYDGKRAYVTSYYTTYQSRRSAEVVLAAYKSQTTSVKAAKFTCRRLNHGWVAARKVDGVTEYLRYSGIMSDIDALTLDDITITHIPTIRSKEYVETMAELVNTASLDFDVIYDKGWVVMNSSCDYLAPRSDDIAEADITRADQIVVSPTAWRFKHGYAAIRVRDLYVKNQETTESDYQETKEKKEKMTIINFKYKNGEFHEQDGRFTLCGKLAEVLDCPKANIQLSIEYYPMHNLHKADLTNSLLFTIIDGAVYIPKKQERYPDLPGEFMTAIRRSASSSNDSLQGRWFTCKWAKSVPEKTGSDVVTKEWAAAYTKEDVPEERYYLYKSLRQHLAVWLTFDKAGSPLLWFGDYTGSALVTRVSDNEQALTRDNILAVMRVLGRKI